MTKCPCCMHSPCYVSLEKVECSNFQCRFYSADLYPINTEISSKALYPEPSPVATEPVEQEDPNKVLYYWSHYHSDNGD
jgi:hypothetical protein